MRHANVLQQICRFQQPNHGRGLWNLELAFDQKDKDYLGIGLIAETIYIFIKYSAKDFLCFSCLKNVGVSPKLSGQVSDAAVVELTGNLGQVQFVVERQFFHPFNFVPDKAFL